MYLFWLFWKTKHIWHKFHMWSTFHCDPHTFHKFSTYTITEIIFRRHRLIFPLHILCICIYKYRLLFMKRPNIVYNMSNQYKTFPLLLQLFFSNFFSFFYSQIMFLFVYVDKLTFWLSILLCSNSFTFIVNLIWARQQISWQKTV